jgi:hypothetical protein
MISSHQSCFKIVSTDEHSIDEYKTRRAGIEKLFGDKDIIIEELGRQAKQYMCGDERVQLERCQQQLKVVDKPNNENSLASSHLLEKKSKCMELENVFNKCVARCTNEKSIAEYQEAGRKGTETMFVKRERSFEMAQATRLHFSLGM